MNNEEHDKRKFIMKSLPLLKEEIKKLEDSSSSDKTIEILKNSVVLGEKWLRDHPEDKKQK